MALDAFELKAAEGIPSGKAVVKADSADIFSEMSVKSKKIKSLKKGDVLTVEVELQGAEGAWCGIAEQGQSTIAGYVKCDYLEREEAKKTRWKQIGSSAGKSSFDKTRVMIANNKVFVPVTLDYEGNSAEALLVLDTGASLSLISAGVADQLHIHTESARKIPVGGIGGVAEVALTRLNLVTVEPHLKKDFVVGVIRDSSFKFDGLLGMDFLRGLKYHIDFENRVIRWNE